MNFVVSPVIFKLTFAAYIFVSTPVIFKLILVDSPVIFK